MLSQVLVRYCIILPAFDAEYHITNVFPEHLSDFHFILLVSSTVLIAAAGYIINDYFDVDIDEINRPGKNIIGKKINGESARNLFFILSSAGVLSGFYVAWSIGKVIMGLIPLFSAVSLWMYSSLYKRRLFSGNVLISLLCALSIVIVGLYEPAFYRNFIFLIWFAVPAFLLSLIREIIKDMEDMEGDELSRCKTAPIVLGVRNSKRIVLGLILLLAAFISYILYTYFYTNTVINFWYLLLIFQIPVTGLIYLVLTANGKKDFHYASMSSKILMLGGIFSMYFFWFYFLK